MAARVRDLIKAGLIELRQHRRSQLGWQMREALDPESQSQVALPPDRKPAAELAAPTWKLTGGDRIQIESKQDIKKRLGSSTDRADAACLAWHKRDLARAKGSRDQHIALSVGIKIHREDFL